MNRSNKQRYRLQSGFNELERPKSHLVNSVHRDVYAIVHSQASRDAFTAWTHPVRSEVTFGPYQGRRPKYLSPYALYIERAVVPFKLSSTSGDCAGGEITRYFLDSSKSGKVRGLIREQNG